MTAVGDRADSRRARTDFRAASEHTRRLHIRSARASQSIYLCSEHKRITLKTLFDGLI